MGTEIGDHRWEGMSNEQLAAVITDLRRGAGPNQLAEAVDALRLAADHLVAIDDTLHSQLGALGVAWRSVAAAPRAQHTTAAAAQYAGLSHDAVHAAADAVDRYGAEYQRVRNALPDPAALTPAPTGGFAPPDHAAALQAAGEARAVAVDLLTGYTEAGRSGLAAHLPLPAAPATAVHATPPAADPSRPTHPVTHPAPTAADTAVPSSAAHSPAELTPSAPAAFAAAATGTAAPGTAAAQTTAAQTTAAENGSETPVAQGIGAAAGLAATTPPPATAEPLQPGSFTTAVAPSAAEAAHAEQRRRDHDGQDEAAVGAGVLGTAGGIAGATGEPDQVVPRRTVAAPPLPGQPPVRRGDSMLEPATSRADGEDDDSRVRRFAVEDDDLFQDARSVIPPVIGD